MDVRDTTSGRSFMFRRPSDRGSWDPAGRRALKARQTSDRDNLHRLACHRDRFRIRISGWIRINDRVCPCSHPDSVRTGRRFPAARHLRRPQVRRSAFLVSHSRARRRVLQVSDDRVVQRAANLLDPFVIVPRRMHAIRQNYDV